ncbi:endonuclease/exonuclease/phosphatase family protein [Parvibaculum sp.]|jgi:endonuclease/exonuclease/phosphatase family metal-dependent hydrolase|uniref:endonuclease/exonuclease/phosphatase family protein n=1 Tax=Parvibaculum sp. TaxID=2024848 RepID=UPI000C543D64|nr:endonuclease/exonuclease/phosphatase family protein [Parvibaculum sp.]MAM94607.1 endonuclease/exonuclease/phosphatase [Parvibaculum sp.]HCX66577.1 endonuclease/exonuclease/phosphatase [Rhodobiaceae bacterium]|tara:strand:+ start:7391 stop:8080 length:690 start_codon:yes stop_codon:yes gene_type:complete
MRQGLRVLSWNIHGGIGPDRRYDLSRIVDLVAAHDADVIALQEIDSRGRSGSAAPLLMLTEALGEHAAEARTISAPDGHYGHAVISRFPLASICVHDLSFRAREPRCAISATVEAPEGRFRLVTTHLGLSIWERHMQSARLAALARAGEGPCIMMGDFNDWFSFGWVRRRLKRELPSRTMERTFPAFRPLLRLDRIYCGSPARLMRSWTDDKAREASDHLPIIADIAFH